MIQISDLHLFEDKMATLKGIPVWRTFEAVLSHIREHHPDLDRLVVTGDHTHDEQRATYDAIRVALTDWLPKLNLVPGNHDDRTLIADVFADRFSSGTERLKFLHSLGEWLLIGLDSHIPGEVHGCVSTTQLDWLVEELATRKESCVGIFLHHPPVPVNSEWMDAISLANGLEVAGVITKHDQIRFVSCGHVHHEFAGQLGHAAVYTTPSTGLQFDPAGATPTMARAAPGYRVFELDDEGEYQTYIERLADLIFTPAIE